MTPPPLVRAGLIAKIASAVFNAMLHSNLRTADAFWLVAFIAHELCDQSDASFEKARDEFWEIVSRRVVFMREIGVMNALQSIDEAEAQWNDVSGPGAVPDELGHKAQTMDPNTKASQLSQLRMLVRRAQEEPSLPTVPSINWSVAMFALVRAGVLDDLVGLEPLQNEAEPTA